MKNILLFVVLACVGYSVTATADTSKLTPKCKTLTKEGDAACWMKVANHNDCYSWNPFPQTDEKVTWSGRCKVGEPDGKGKLVWKYDGGVQTSAGTYVNGQEHGKWEIQYEDGSIYDAEYVNGKEIQSTPRINPKFIIQGEILHYNTDLAATEAGQEITSNDRDFFEKALKENPDIEVIYLTSWGGDSGAASEISDLIIDYDLDTHGVEICFSGCTTLLLSGKKRTLERGSKVGFHRSWWPIDNLKYYYDENKEHEGWGNAFDFAAWIYEDTQEEIYKDFEFLLERGIDPLFAIKTLKSDSDDGWFPRRKELLDANFLTK